MRWLAYGAGALILYRLYFGRFPWEPDVIGTQPVDDSGMPIPTFGGGGGGATMPYPEPPPAPQSSGVPLPAPIPHLVATGTVRQFVPQTAIRVTRPLTPITRSTSGIGKI